MATPDRSGAEFARMVGQVVQQYPFAKTIHLVMDNLNSHTVPPSESAAVKALYGLIPMNGKLPVSIAPYHAGMRTQ